MGFISGVYGGMKISVICAGIPNTIKWVFISLFLQFTIGFMFALFLKNKFRGRGVYQGVIFFPWAVSGFLIGIRIVFPLILSGFSATFIFCFVQAWNDLFSPIMYMNRQINYTIPVALNYMVQKNDIRWGELSAGAVIAVVPTVIMFAFAQKYVAAGLIAGAVKV